MRIPLGWSLPLLVGALAAGCTPRAAHGQAAVSKKEVGKKELLRHALESVPGNDVRVLRLELPPGASIPAHRHPGSIVGYVISGAVESQLEGQPRRRFVAGETFYEAPSHLHLVTRNDDPVAPAVVLAFFVGPTSQAMTVPEK
jgi:quercetin dioxygenase-like cupin family protein